MSETTEAIHTIEGIETAQTPLTILIAGLGGVTTTFYHWPERVLAKALVKRGHRVWAIGTRDEQRPPLAAAHETIDGIEVFRVRSGYMPNRELARALGKGPEPDIIHLMHPRNVLAAQITWWAKRREIPRVYTWLGPFHDHYAIPDRERPFEVEPTYERLAFTVSDMARLLVSEWDARDVLRNFWLHWPLAAADGLIPCSLFEADMMRKFGMIQPQTVVPLWIDADYIAQTPHIAPSLPHPRPWVLFVGQLTPRKGYDLALRALPTIVETYPTASLLIVSGLNQAQREQTLALARELGVEEHVHLLGYLPDDQLVNLYRSSDVFLFPTRYEGFGLPLLEAMAAGCPIITTDIPVVREIVHDGEHGVLVPYNDAEALGQAAIALLGDGERQAALAARGRERLQEVYHETVCVEKIETVYREVLARKGHHLPPPTKRL